MTREIPLDIKNIWRKIIDWWKSHRFDKVLAKFCNKFHDAVLLGLYSVHSKIRVMQFSKIRGARFSVQPAPTSHTYSLTTKAVPCMCEYVNKHDKLPVWFGGVVYAGHRCIWQISSIRNTNVGLLPSSVWLSFTSTPVAIFQWTQTVVLLISLSLSFEWNLQQWHRKRLTFYTKAERKS